MLAPELDLFARSLLIGLSIAAPVGPIGLLVIQRTLQQGLAVGLATGLGAAVADALYGAVGAFGVQGLIQTLQGARVPLALAGGMVMLVLAWRTWRAPLATGAAAAPAATAGLLAAFGATFVLTLSNPATILSFVAIFGAMSAGMAAASPWLMVLGVLLGSALWWLMLCAGVAQLHTRFNDLWRQRINGLSALVLAVFGLLAMVSATSQGMATI